jgi:hypothetical protein
MSWVLNCCGYGSLMHDSMSRCVLCHTFTKDCFGFIFANLLPENGISHFGIGKGPNFLTKYTWHQWAMAYRCLLLCSFCRFTRLKVKNIILMLLSYSEFVWFWYLLRIKQLNLCFVAEVTFCQIVSYSFCDVSCFLNLISVGLRGPTALTSRLFGLNLVVTHFGKKSKYFTSCLYLLYDPCAMSHTHNNRGIFQARNKPICDKIFCSYLSFWVLSFMLNGLVL